jgi:hypothetical protein
MKFLAYIRKPLLYSFAVGLGLGCASVVLAAWSGPLSPPPTCTSGNPGCDAPLNVSGSTQDKGSIIFAGTAGNVTAVGLSATSVILSPEFCIGSSCITAWPSGGGGSSQWTTSGNYIYNSNPGDVMIDQTSPILPSSLDLTYNGNTEQGATFNNSVANAAGAALRLLDQGTSVGGIFVGTYGTYIFLNPNLNSGVVSDGNNGVEINTSGTTRMEVNSSGNVGIGTTNPGYPLDVNGAVRASAFYYSSDERLKTNIATIASSTALADVLALNPVTFNWKNPAMGTSTQIGFIAQEVQKVVPEIVSTNASTTMESVDYARVTPLLVGSVQELDQKIEDQQTQINTQQQEIDTLTAEIQALEAGR